MGLEQLGCTRTWVVLQFIHRRLTIAFVPPTSIATVCRVSIVVVSMLAPLAGREVAAIPVAAELLLRHRQLLRQQGKATASNLEILVHSRQWVQLNPTSQHWAIPTTDTLAAGGTGLRLAAACRDGSSQEASRISPALRGRPRERMCCQVGS